MKKNKIRKIYELMLNKVYLSLFAGSVLMNNSAWADPLLVKITGENGFREINLTDPDVITYKDISNAPFLKGGITRENIISVYVLPNIKNIDENAFLGCRNLESIVFEGSCELESIGDNAFNSCKKLRVIDIPASVKTIGKHAFWSCDALEYVIFGKDSQLTEIGEDAFSGAKLTRIIIPASVRVLGKSALSCNTLNDVIFEPNSQLTEIGRNAFSGTKLTKIIIPSGVQTISDTAFWSCKLKKIYVPEHFLKEEDKESFLDRLGVPGNRSAVEVKTTRHPTENDE